MSDQYDAHVFETVGEATDDNKKATGNLVEATLRIMTAGYGDAGVWLRSDGRAEIVPNWVVSARKAQQQEGEQNG